MYNKETIISKIYSVLEHIAQVNQNTDSILTPDDYFKTKQGILLYDSTLIRLQAIGENLKKIQLSAPEILTVHSGVDWDSIIRLRDIISHHYEKLQEEVVFDICKIFIPSLEKTVREILTELKKN